MTTRYDESRKRAWAQLKGNLTKHSVELVSCGEVAIEYLMEHQGFTPLTKEQFALKLGWVTNPPDEKPDRRLVEDICNLTRDVEQSRESFPDAYPDWVHQALGGYVVAYSPNDGGMTLIGDDLELDARQFIHVITGDLQRQQSIKTMNRRRLPTYTKCAQGFADRGETAMAMVLAKAENEIATNGMVSDYVVGELYKTGKALGVIES